VHSTERRLRNNGEAMRNKARSAVRPSERSEKLDRIVGRSRYAAEINLKSVYNSHRCLISGT